MADVRKTVTSAEDEKETVEQNWSDTNTQVVALFESKPDLGFVSLMFTTGDTKQKVYERL